MTLSEHDGDYYIDVEGEMLMSTRAHGSEAALASLAASDLEGISHPRVLIGGLGLGFTLGAALDVMPPGASLVVVEFFAAIVDWNRKFCFGSEADRLADPRVAVVVADVAEYIRDARDPFDAILLDVDNGPDAWTLDSNGQLYDRAGLERIQRALRPNGLLAIWSADASQAFEKRLSAAGFAARSERVRARDGKGPLHTIFLGRAPGSIRSRWASSGGS